MLQTLVFFHVLGAAGLFCGMALEMSALLRLHRASTMPDVRAAVANVPAIGPLMGLSSLLLFVMGIALIYAGGFGWSDGWINAVFALAVILALVGPLVTGRKAEAIHALALSGGNGGVTAELDAARRDRVFNYNVFLSCFGLIAALYVMVTKPDTVTAVAVLVAAFVLAGLGAAMVLRRSGAGATAET